MKFAVSWKGKVLGDFTRADIEDAVKRGEFGMLHRVSLGASEEITIEEFLRGDEEDLSKLSGGNFVQEEISVEPPTLKYVSDSSEKNFAFDAFGYALAGLSFLSVWTLFSAMAYSLFLFMAGKNSEAFKCAILSILCGIAGLAFFHYFNSL